MKEIILTDKAPAPIGPYSQAIKAGNLLFLSGQIGINPATGQMQISMEDQTRQIMKNIHAIMEKCGCGLESILKTTIFLVNLQDFAKVNDLYKEYFTGDFPARTTVEVSRLPKSALIEIEAIALIQ